MLRTAILIIAFFSLCLRINAQTVELPDSLLVLLNKAIKEKNKEQECELTYKLASSYVFGGDTEKAIEYTEKAAELAAATGQNTIRINSMNLHARTLRQAGKLDEAIQKYSEATELAKEFGDTLLYANSLENLGIAYGASGKTDYPKALEYYLEAARLKENIKEWSQLAGTYKRISALYYDTGDTQKREKYLLKAIVLVEQRDDINLSFKAATYNEAGRFYTDEKVDYEKALLHFDKVLEISKKIGWKKGIAVSLSNKANVFENMGDYEKALALYLQTLQLKEEMQDTYGMAKSYESIGSVYIHQRNFNQAIQAYKKALELSQTAGMTNELKESFLGLYKAYKANSNYNLALKNYEYYSALSDSIAGENHQKVLAELETKYETEKKEKQIEQLTAEKQIEALRSNQRKLIVIILTVLLAILIVTVLFVNRQKRLKTQKNESELKQRLLRSQMNPHFIFNALSSIQNFIYSNEPQTAGKYLTNFSKLMRDILESSSVELIPLDQELGIVKNYLTLQEMRKEGTFSFQIKAPENTDEYIIPPMIAQPFIENAVIHAFKGIDYKGEIRVKYVVADPYFIISIEDNGIGINNIPQQAGKHKSVAIKLTRQRLSLFNYKNIHSNIEIINKSETNEQGTIVEISLPLERCLKF